MVGSVASAVVSVLAASCYRLLYVSVEDWAVLSVRRFACVLNYVYFDQLPLLPIVISLPLVPL